ncbi:hypothetical protein D9M72_319010 [compost metagenome]
MDPIGRYAGPGRCHRSQWAMGCVQADLEQYEQRRQRPHLPEHRESCDRDHLCVLVLCEACWRAQRVDLCPRCSRRRLRQHSLQSVHDGCVRRRLQRLCGRVQEGGRCWQRVAQGRDCLHDGCIRNAGRGDLSRHCVGERGQRRRRSLHLGCATRGGAIPQLLYLQRRGPLRARVHWKLLRRRWCHALCRRGRGAQ